MRILSTSSSFILVMNPNNSYSLSNGLFPRDNQYHYFLSPYLQFIRLCWHHALNKLVIVGVVGLARTDRNLSAILGIFCFDLRFRIDTIPLLFLCRHYFYRTLTPEFYWFILLINFIGVFLFPQEYKIVKGEY